MKEYKNPYHGIRVAFEKGVGPKPGRINADIDATDFQFLFGLRLGAGTQQTTVNLLLHRLIYELKLRGITSVTQSDAFEHFVANCRFVLPGETLDATASGVSGTTNDGPCRIAPAGHVKDVGSRPPGVRKGTKPVKK